MSSYQQQRVESNGNGILSSYLQPVQPESGSGNFISRNKKAVMALVSVLGIAAFAFSATQQPRNGNVSVTNSALPDTSMVTFPIDLEGKHKKKKKSKHSDDDDKSDDDDDTVENVCEDGGYSKRTLKMAYELPFASLFRDSKDQKKYEASSVVIKDGYAYAVCDSSWAISKFDIELQPFASGNIQIGDPDREAEEESGYEALFFDEGLFYVIRESIQHTDESYHAIVEALAVNEDDYEIVEICSTEFEFEGNSKGFEGAVSVRDLNNITTILALCEGNKCGQDKDDKDRGHGRIVAMQKAVVNGTCIWETLSTIHVPKSAYFLDYSAIAMSDSGRVAVTSQEDSQVWIGQLLGQTENGLWNVTAMEFDSDAAKVYDFPKNHECETIYCNIEGVHWINNDMLMTVSDKMKGKGKQDFRCFEKDQSVHVFVLP